MNRIIKYGCSFFNVGLVMAILYLVTGSLACKQDHLPTVSTGGHDYAQINLVADTEGFGAVRIDSNLGNPWGMAISPKGKVWICCNNTGRCMIYDNNGNQLYTPVNNPLNGNPNGASPDGIIFNATQDFPVNGKPAVCLCSTEDGIIKAWNTGDSTTTVADRSVAGAVYKGIAIANDGTGNFIYVTDFFNAKIDVYDKAFNRVTGKAFADPNIPAGFAPFNICNIGGNLFVTYAKQKGPAYHDDQTGAGNGYIDVFNPDGLLIKRFASQGTLNSPWGIAQAPDGFGQVPNAILVSNYGDGHITVFDTSGAYKGQIETDGIPVTISGLWDITFISGNNTQLYFTSGPADESYGLFGYLKVK